jgi:Cu(I)/Ag(I) efflux system membrane fusion protein
MKHHVTWRCRLIAAGLTAMAVFFFLPAVGLAASIHDHSGHSLPAGPNHAADDAAETEATVYYCSMHPQVRSTNPDDQCPICGMDLIPMPSETKAGAAGDRDLPVLALTKRSASLMGIRTMPAERRAATIEVRFVGRLDLDERRITDVTARTDGYIDRLYADFEGMPVKKGGLLADFYSPPVIAAARELLVVHQAHGAGPTSAMMAAARARLDRLGLSDGQVAAIMAAKEVPRSFSMTSPADGVIFELGAREGEWLREGGRLLRIADLSMLWLLLEAYETDLQWLHPGQDAEFTLQAFPGEVFSGAVSFVDPMVNPQTRTVRVRVDVSNPEGRFKPGMFARGRIMAAVGGDGGPAASGMEQAHEPLLIPASAPLVTGRRAIVYVQAEDADRPMFEGRQIVLGPRVGDDYVVREGLAAGERVVVNGQFKIDSELQIRGRPSMMARADEFSPPDGSQAGISHDHSVHDAGPGPAPAPGAAHGSPPGTGASEADAVDHGDHAAHTQEPAAGAAMPDADADVLLEDYPLDVCIVSGAPLDSMGGPVVHEYKGRRILFCCEGCRPLFEADPEKYLKKLDEAASRKEQQDQSREHGPGPEHNPSQEHDRSREDDHGQEHDHGQDQDHRPDDNHSQGHDH